MTTATSVGLRGRTAWVRNLAAPVRDFLSNETGGAIVMLAGAVFALLWANSPWRDTYESFWTTHVSVSVGGGSIALDLRHLVNQGLMTFFFLVVGLGANAHLGPAPPVHRGVHTFFFRGGGARGQARARPRRAARPQPPHDRGGRGDRRDG